MVSCVCVSAKGNRERKRKPGARKENRCVKVRARKSQERWSANAKAEVGKVTFKSNGDEALNNEFLLKSNGDEALNDGFP